MRWSSGLATIVFWSIVYSLSLIAERELIQRIPKRVPPAYLRPVMTPKDVGIFNADPSVEPRSSRSVSLNGKFGRYIQSAGLCSRCLRKIDFSLVGGSNPLCCGGLSSGPNRERATQASFHGGSLPDIPHNIIYKKTVLCLDWFLCQGEVSDRDPRALVQPSIGDAGIKGHFTLSGAEFHSFLAEVCGGFERSSPLLFGLNRSLLRFRQLPIHQFGLPIHDYVLSVEYEQAEKGKNTYRNPQADLPSLEAREWLAIWGFVLAVVGIGGMGYGLYIARVGRTVRGFFI
jgi:hypothetical protein